MIKHQAQYFSPHASELESWVRQVTGAAHIGQVEVVQELWSGYGKILRLELVGSNGPGSVIAKWIRVPDEHHHPRGWVSDLSHQRKLKSYEVELAWYRTLASRCDALCRVPAFLGSERKGGQLFLLLEDLNVAGYSKRIERPDGAQVDACIQWLAEFHACFMGGNPTGLWEVGTYWHLATRPDELAALEDEVLREVAPKIDRVLADAEFQTFVHGDAKLANFCFSEDGKSVAAVDFQYVGCGCGMKDLAYFMGSCFDQAECEANEGRLLDRYFGSLEVALDTRKVQVDFDRLEKEWRSLYPVAWTDFYRFLKGWCPDHWKIHEYSERLAREVVGRI